MEKYFRTKEVAKILGISQNTVMHWIDKGILAPVIVIPGKKRVVRIPDFAVYNLLRKRGFGEEEILAIVERRGAAGS